MQWKDAYSPSPEGAPPDQAAANLKSKFDDIFPTRRDASGISGQGGGKAQVTKDMVEELDRSQRLLASAIGLALAVSEARLKAETASIGVRRIVRSSASNAGVGDLQDLAGTLAEIAPLEPQSSGDSDFSDRLLRSLENFQQTRTGAKDEAQTIVRQMAAPDAGQLEQGRVVTLSEAISDLRMALSDCANACAGESQDHVKSIEYRVQSILDQFDRQHESSAKPPGEKQPNVGGGARSPQSSAGPDRKSAVSENGGELNLQNERSGDHGLERPDRIGPAGERGEDERPHDGNGQSP